MIDRMFVYSRLIALVALVPKPEFGNQGTRRARFTGSEVTVKFNKLTHI